MRSLDALCSGCFEEKADVSQCPRCGYDAARRPSPLVLPPGTVLNGQYLVGRVLGKPGGFGITYLGWDLRLETRVAIKEFLPRDFAARDMDGISVRCHSDDDYDSFQTGLGQFLQEARTLARFDHPNVVRVRTFFEEFGTAYLVMDYYEGLTLGEYTQSQEQGRLPEHLAIDIMVPVLDGLTDVHAKGFLHRDIKPANIYLTTGGRPILLDFGAAKEAASDRSRTMTVLTPGFAPWEQYRQGGVRHPTADIYACGATLYYLMSGQVPTEAPERMTGDPLPPLHELVPGVSHRVSEAVSWAMAVHAQSRPQDVREFQDALLGARTVKGPQGTGTGGASTRPPHDPPDSEPARLQAVALTVTPESALLDALGDTQRLAARVLASGGEVLSAASVAWTSSDPGVASVDAKGVVTAVRAGVAEIEARHADVAGVVRVEVQQKPASIVLSPARVTLAAPPEMDRIQAKVLDRNKNEVPGAAVEWTTSDPRVAAMDGEGLVRAVGKGTTEVRASAGAARAAVKVAVKRDAKPAGPAPVGDPGSGSAAPAPRRSRVPLVVAACVGVPLLALGLFQMGSSGNETDAAVVSAEAPAAEPGYTAGGIAEGPSPTAGGTAPAPAPVVASPARVRLTGDLPAGAEVRVDGDRVSGRVVELRPGQTHRVVVTAPGHETASREFALAAGEERSWSPTLQRVPQPTPDPEPVRVPTRDLRAEAAAIQSSVAGLVRVLDSGDIGGVRAAYRTAPEGEVTAWQILLETFPNRSATLLGSSAPQIQGDQATVDFRVSLTTTNPDGTRRSEPLAVRAKLVRVGAENWKFTSLLYGR